VLAHRGLAVEAPENTLLAFAKALAAGATHLETDVHASADGVAILSHDPDLFRLTGRHVRIDQLTASELARIDLGGAQSFATLAAALHAFPDARFNIDVKAASAVVPTMEAIRHARAEHRVLIGSFSNARRLAVVRRLPGVATSVSSRGAVIATWAGALGMPRLTRWALRGVHAVQLPVRVLGARTTSPRAIAAYHSAGVEVHIWNRHRSGRHRARGTRPPLSRVTGSERSETGPAPNPGPITCESSEKRRDRAFFRPRCRYTCVLTSRGGRAGNPGILRQLSCLSEHADERPTGRERTREATQWQIVVCAACDSDLRACKAK